ncbi:MAG TPA: DUF134 domain-containing protein [Clostridia bacterium]|mgnify:FL=1|jgi:predicted DNA-binding protein (UPF0251 family)|nr:DUF134 domain-containing protein [Clostridia bacterium]HPA60464.1 DUF134 domain-containing protein [Clostridia bacterium]HPY44026.1 DUF134 domain-containing protein [Clostridia bacterium]HQA97834.1 DUF134 domain-containing protein [Clostridia bacterium]HQO56289.1 DUF134 domain-containing protein [Clostridia bacterium]
MARPIKGRRVCSLPRNARFGPLGQRGRASAEIVMTVDEYETIRLIDNEGYTQEECAQQMNVARTTVTGIYAQARRKVARALVEGLRLVISGGEYRLCGDQGGVCGRGCRHRGGQAWRRDDPSQPAGD